jgi:hypothetical protein
MQCRAPGVSTIDAQFVRGEVLGRSAFGGFSDQERAVILENILAFRRTIPSLYTFFQDIHFLEACADSVKWLVTVPPGKALFTTLGGCYVRTDETQYVQVTETTFHSMHGSREDCKRLGYLGLIAFAMRHHSSLPKRLVKTNLTTIPRAHADREVLQRFASLAAKLGFDTPEIQELAGNVDHLLISDSPNPSPLLVTAGHGEAIKHRCGLPHTDTFEADRKSLFLHNLCDERGETGEGITSFFVLKSWFAAFFDSPRWRLASILPTTPAPAVDLQHTPGEDIYMGCEGVGGLDHRESGQEPPVAGPAQEATGGGLRELLRPAVEGPQVLGQEEDPLFGTLPTHIAPRS